MDQFLFCLYQGRASLEGREWLTPLVAWLNFNFGSSRRRLRMRKLGERCIFHQVQVFSFAFYKWPKWMYSWMYILECIFLNVYSWACLTSPSLPDAPVTLPTPPVTVHSCLCLCVCVCVCVFEMQLKYLANWIASGKKRGRQEGRKGALHKGGGGREKQHGGWIKWWPGPGELHQVRVASLFLWRG